MWGVRTHTYFELCSILFWINGLWRGIRVLAWLWNSRMVLKLNSTREIMCSTESSEWMIKMFFQRLDSYTAFSKCEEPPLLAYKGLCLFPVVRGRWSTDCIELSGAGWLRISNSTSWCFLIQNTPHSHASTHYKSLTQERAHTSALETYAQGKTGARVCREAASQLSCNYSSSGANLQSHLLTFS